MSRERFSDKLERKVEYNGDTLSSTVKIEGEKPPEELRVGVEEAIENTIIHQLDGKTVEWKKINNGWRLRFVDGISEWREIDEKGNEVVRPMYMSFEKFEGQMKDIDGLYNTLPDEWDFEREKEFVYQLYNN